MKKLLALLMAIALLFTFVGCPNGNEPDTPDTPSTPSTPSNPDNSGGQENPEENLPALPEDYEAGNALDLAIYYGYAEEGEITDWFVKDIAGLEKLSSLVKAGTTDFDGWTVSLEADIDMNPGLPVLDDNFEFIGDPASLYNFRPIGDNSTGKLFSGTFDGKNHVIRGLYININDEKIKGVGLFGKTGDATIKDLAIIDSYVTVGEKQKDSDISRIGTLVGLVAGSTIISNCYIKGSVNGPWLGSSGINGNGIVGTQTAGNCYGSEYIGGIVGRFDTPATITDCIFNGKVYNAHAQAGGILGNSQVENTEVTISNCLVMGKSISCPGDIGVICGTFDVPGNFVLDTVEVVSNGAYKNGAFVITSEMLGNHIESVTAGEYSIYKMKAYAEEGISKKTISFNANWEGSTDEIAPVEVYIGGLGKPAADPDRDGYVFVGWYKAADADIATASVFKGPVTEDITLYAGWAPAGTVSFDVTTNWAENTETVKAVKVAIGSTVAKPSLTKAPEGKVLKGWFLNDAEFDFATPISGDITLVAQWEDVPATPAPEPTTGTEQ